MQAVQIDEMPGSHCGTCIAPSFKLLEVAEQLKLYPHLDCTHLCCPAYQSNLISTQPCTVLSDKLLNPCVTANLERAVG